MIDFMIEARKHNKTIKVRYGKVLFSGSSGAGKTSFYKLLMNRKRSKHHISTGLVQSEQVVAAVKVDVRRKDEFVELYELNIKEEIFKLHSLLNTMTSKHSINIPKTVSAKEVKLCNVELEIAKDRSLPDVSKTEFIDTTEKRDEMNLFTFMDTGGQPQFISMLPAVSNSAMVTFLIHDVRAKLNDPVKVAHGDKDGKQTFVPYTIGCTNLELIKNLICFTNNSLLRKKPFLGEISENRTKESISYLSFIGSHLDEALASNNDETHIHEIDDNLDIVVKDTGLEHVFRKVHHDYKYLIPVNNLTSEGENEYGTHDSVKKIRKKLYDKILLQEVYNVPIVWVLLELEIRSKCEIEEQKFITYQEIVELCQQHNLIQNEDDIKNGLRFFHLFGLLLYFDEVPELSDYVFTDYQWLFNNLTEIVYQSYLQYDQDNIKVQDDFKWKGFFKESLLDKCKLKLKHQSKSSEIDFTQGFIKLLKYLRIVAPVLQEDNSIIYFMPSLLSMCDFGTNKESFPPGVLPDNNVVCNETEPLLIQFKLCNTNKPGSFPRGTFCCLVVELLQDRLSWCLFWSDSKEKVFDNLVTLLYRETGQYVTLIDRIFYLEVVMLQETRSSMHYKIKNILKEALYKIGVDLNFESFLLTFGFICCKCLSQDRHTLCSESSNLKFNCCYGHSTDKTSKYTVWDEVCILRFCQQLQLSNYYLY